jgi:hypothetical protein
MVETIILQGMKDPGVPVDSRFNNIIKPILHHGILGILPT